MDTRWIYGVKALVIGCVLGCVRVAHADDEVESPSWMGRAEFKIGYAHGETRISGIPDQMRSVRGYHKSESYLLPSETEGGYGGLILGVGLAFRHLEWTGFNVDFSFMDSFHKGRDTWSEIGFPSDDYIGYRYHSINFDVSAKLIPFSYTLSDIPWEVFQLYARVGFRTRIAWLNSGTDAWNEFEKQHDMSLFGESILLGVGVRVYVFEIEYLVSRPWLGADVPEEWVLFTYSAGGSKEKGCGALLSLFCD